MNDRLKIQRLRSFGLIVGGIFLAIGLCPALWSGAPPTMWALVIGSLLTLVGGILPHALEPVYRAWMAVGHVMGWVNTRIVMGLFFFGILTPFAFIARLLGIELMGVQPRSDAGTYRVLRTVRPVTHVEHQF